MRPAEPRSHYGAHVVIAGLGLVLGSIVGLVIAVATGLLTISC
ncbi:MAG TPA: hypothetical protein VGC55_05915 [Dokdonella sp.]